MARGEKTGGRQKGTPNKVSALAREAIAFAANKLGGAKRLAEWAKEAPENEATFWSKIYPRLLPLEVHGSGPNGEHEVNVNYSDDERAKALAVFMQRKGLPQSEERWTLQ